MNRTASRQTHITYLELQWNDSNQNLFMCWMIQSKSKPKSNEGHLSTSKYWWPQTLSIKSAGAGVSFQNTIGENV